MISDYNTVGRVKKPQHNFYDVISLEELEHQVLEALGIKEWTSVVIRE